MRLSRMLPATLSTLRTAYKQTLDKADALVKRMRTVYASPKYEAVWNCLPTFMEEIVVKQVGQSPLLNLTHLRISSG
jgi:hypothetical protein